MDCVNCGQPVTTPFCPACGQWVGVKRLTFRDTLRDFWIQIAGFDGFFLRTLRDLTIRPGLVAARYIAGVRVVYFGPIAYFFFTITLLLLWINILGLDFAELIRNRQEAITSQSQNPVTVMMTQFVSDNMRWVLFLAVPFQAFAARFIFFRKSGYNFIEHTVPLFYTSGHLFWITMLVFAYKKYMDDMLVLMPSLLSYAYFGYVYGDLMRYQSRAKAFLKGVGVYFGGQLLFVMTLSIIIIVTVIIIALIDPKLLDGFRPSQLNAP